MGRSGFGGNAGSIGKTGRSTATAANHAASPIERGVTAFRRDANRSDPCEGLIPYRAEISATRYGVQFEPVPDQLVAEFIATNRCSFSISSLRNSITRPD